MPLGQTLFGFEWKVHRYELENNSDLISLKYFPTTLHLVLYNQWIKIFLASLSMATSNAHIFNIDLISLVKSETLSMLSALAITLAEIKSIEILSFEIRIL